MFDLESKISLLIILFNLRFCFVSFNAFISISTKVILLFLKIFFDAIPRIPVPQP